MKPRYYQLGLIGYPLAHSRSPELHRTALARCGLEGDYHLFPCEPSSKGLEDIKDLIFSLRQRKLHGLNVTIPHKQTVIPLVDQLTEVARAVGAVNTLYVSEAGRLIGENTDVPGFMNDIQRLIGNKIGEAVVLGAGGSARAVVYALARAGWGVTVFSRREAQAAILVREIGQSIRGDCGLEADILTAEALKKSKYDLIVNTTPLGMYPDVETCPWPDGVSFLPDSAVYDLVYNPSETVLVKRAIADKLPAMNGAGMLAAQAALAFQLWTGIEPPLDEMRNALL